VKVARGIDMRFRSVSLPTLAMAGLAIAGPISYNYTTIVVPGSTQTIANGINNAGDVVGEYNADRFHGFLLDIMGHLQTIDFPGAQSTVAQRINSSGAIVGAYIDSQGVVHGFLDNHGVFTTIDPPGSTFTVAYGINASGQISGTFTGTQSPSRGFVDDNGIFTTISAPGLSGGPIEVHGINDAGDVVGFGDGLGFLDVNGTFRFIDIGGHHDVEALGINNARVVVGTDFQTLSGFLDVDGSISTIKFPGALFTGANGINDHGRIVGYYTLGNCPIVQCGYIATPVPEPRPFGVVGLIGAALLWRR
jgi:uncharacterized membrane protein